MPGSTNAHPTEPSVPAPPSVVIRQAEGADDIAAVERCFDTYTQWLDMDISFQDYEAERNGLPGKYAAPSGALLLAVDGDGPSQNVLGCIAMRPIELDGPYMRHRPSDGRYCEVKRLFVYPEARGRQVSRALVREVTKRAAEAGYSEVLLDTMAKMQAAVKLYVSEGFEETLAYNASPLDGVMYFSKKLT
ncbi:GCN5-related N-acetyltransferase (GNAT) domain-containingprotein [Purpureocillium lavendulum]|uniref:GCN5-related N-acetyltransferase (GNAT) domain-containingprotein n=1 Tax=Purpureocillium lavendulum TaxID=1247861 RepID=A0AB34FIM8_9HYPO|nr:GCN5-related N-acetyltransferase (GNAT) domain-containingprotein [Purpureocillium lavendulum]